MHRVYVCCILLKTEGLATLPYLAENKKTSLSRFGRTSTIKVYKGKVRKEPVSSLYICVLSVATTRRKRYSVFVWLQSPVVCRSRCRRYITLSRAISLLRLWPAVSRVLYIEKVLISRNLPWLKYLFGHNVVVWLQSPVVCR